jgi:hypothetical protein
VPQFVAAGQAAPQDAGYVAAYCHAAVCDGDGGIDSGIDDDNVQDSVDPCIQFGCNDGMQTQTGVCDAGATCAIGSECVSTYCVGNVCCDTLCNDSCVYCMTGACATAPAGYPDPSGFCKEDAGLVCDGIVGLAVGQACAGRPGSTCATDLDCLSETCVGSPLRCGRSPGGGACTDNADCLSLDAGCYNNICSN